MTHCGQKNSQESVDINLDRLYVENINGITLTYIDLNEKVYTNSTDNVKVYGDPMSVKPCSIVHKTRLNLTGQQAQLLKTAEEYLNKASEALDTSGNDALATTLKELSSKLNHEFGIE